MRAHASIKPTLHVGLVHVCAAHSTIYVSAALVEYVIGGVGLLAAAYNWRFVVGHAAAMATCERMRI